MKRPENIVVLGSGESGVGAALLAKRLGMRVFVSDKGSIAPGFRQELASEGIGFEEKQHSLDRIQAADAVVKSPGIPNSIPMIRQLRDQGMPVWGEMEFAWRYAGPCRMAAVTGSNGKTTTTELLHHLLLAAGMQVRMGGNVGHAFTRLVADDWQSGRQNDAERVFVLEISSFQLEDTETFRPDVALLLNITPDHLDRYEYRLERYAAAKFRIAQSQQAGDLFLYNADNPATTDYLQMHPVTGPEAIGLRQPAPANGRFTAAGHTFDLSTAHLKGPHNAFNALFALTAALRLGAAVQPLQAALNSFRPPAHRMEPVGEVGGVQFINDSKATNVDSVFYALSAMTQPVVWIAGGQDKGNDYSVLLPLVSEKVKAIVCLGVDNAPLYKAFAHLGKDMTAVQSAEAAVREAAALAHPGDVVLLSPACASFDLFDNYMQRGDLFRQAVQQLISSTKTSGNVTG
ncbi:MAG: UDP-N-acetylmuramoyl-L-alanine--D-glutamate ligase [Saprospiraceae bacterium]|nr:UDP-N-acetylmuramoyl-L-alanine--D-glutamate ligase [Saprospiraceae bacterium]